MAKSWQDVRDRANLDESEVAAHKARMRGLLRAARLAEVPKRHRVGQTELVEGRGPHSPQSA